MSVTAPVTNIARCSLHDGPGVRTVVYLKGCPLRCQWCHNPETWDARPQMLLLPQKCIGCGACTERCPAHRTLDENGPHYRRESCSVCGACADVCTAQAIQRCGEEKTADEVFDTIMRDAHYYRATGGGVTFSGGECLLYPTFVGEIARRCREAGVSCAIESAFAVPWEHIEATIPYIDLFFADLKIPDPEKHRTYTGQDNQRIIENIRRLSHKDTHITIRIPVIPGINDAEEDICGFAEILKTMGPAVKEVELLKYNHLAESKYHAAQETYHSFADAPQSDEYMQAMQNRLAGMTGLTCI